MPGVTELSNHTDALVHSQPSRTSNGAEATISFANDWSAADSPMALQMSQHQERYR